MKQVDRKFLDRVPEAKKDIQKAFELYLSYVSSAKTDKERTRRIHKFRSGFKS